MYHCVIVWKYHCDIVWKYHCVIVWKDHCVIVWKDYVTNGLWMLAETTRSLLTPCPEVEQSYWRPLPTSGLWAAASTALQCTQALTHPHKCQPPRLHQVQHWHQQQWLQQDLSQQHPREHYLQLQQPKELQHCSGKHRPLPPQVISSCQFFIVQDTEMNGQVKMRETITETSRKTDTQGDRQTRRQTNRK